MPSKAGTCFVPGCKSGYKSCAARVSSFRAPKDVLRREKWARNTKRGEKEHTPDCFVCERHFETAFFQRTFRHIINGEVVEMPRDRPQLTDDAVPTLFPDAPKYLTTKAPIKRKERNLCQQDGPPTKKRKATSKHVTQEASEPAREAEQFHPAEPELSPTEEAVHCNTTEAESQSVINLKNLCQSLELPGTGWNKLTFATEPGAVFLGLCEFQQAELDHLLMPKLVKFEQVGDEMGTVHCSVFLRAKLHLERPVSSLDEAQSVLNSTHSLVVCAGCGMKITKVGKYACFAGSYYSNKCNLTCQNKGPCMHCKYLRRLLKNQLSRQKHGVAVKRLRKYEYARTRRRLHAAQLKLLNMKKELELMRAANEQIGDEALNDRITALPQKQQMAIRACFTAAKRKSTCGMPYEKDWILECVLLRMRSPKLYEHLRKQKILILPSRTCLQRYVRNFKSGFGFNDSVFKALGAKAENIDVFSRHGGILFDELKLSEQFGVNTAGAVEGFVDLGSFTTDEQRATPADQGMVMLFQPFQGDWTQILGVFSSKGNIKAGMLSKLLLEAILLAEKASLFGDFVSCDGATWNRSMWKSFGIGAYPSGVTCKVAHPVDPSRELHFCSDFPHLVKCIRNTFVSTGFTTPDGRACLNT
ncbi:uncharacterized protein LOC125940716 [Dermacentor silvarum]|uniref:uncharacterized protein LOC125940716 n=1 Tax=Dermacentor silvarum TaxID=543639 RepID=UPI0021018FB5|nr:uncharacterized protein LOC125940716 [Dermacentor silvarum]